MANTNKVEFGLSNVHVGTYTADAEGAVTLGTPSKINGAVSLALSAETSESPFFADDIVYYNSYSDSGETGDLTMAMFPDSFKTEFLGYKVLEDGGVAKIKGATTKAVYIIFEGKGDAKKRRHILYNVSLGPITREHKTLENGTKTPETESIPVTLTGDNLTSIVKVSYTEGDQGYAALFTTPPIPVVPPTV